MNGARMLCEDIPRRKVLGGTALALGAAAAALAVPQASAEEKITQATASYQSTPKGGDHCGSCVNFRQPHACKFVDGTISPTGWCQLFTPKA